MPVTFQKPGARNNRQRLTAIFLLLALAQLTGCSTSFVRQPLTLTIGASDPDTQLEFWYQLSQRPLACNDEAFHALLLYFDGKDVGDNYPARVAELKRRQLIPKDFNRPADEAVERGTLAVAIVSGLKIRGGLMLTLVGPNPRYATRELEYLNVFPPSSASQEFTGMELVGIIGRVEDYQRGNSGEATVAPGK